MASALNRQLNRRLSPEFLNAAIYLAGLFTAAFFAGAFLATAFFAKNLAPTVLICAPPL